MQRFRVAVDVDPYGHARNNVIIPASFHAGRMVENGILTDLVAGGMVRFFPCLGLYS